MSHPQRIFPRAWLVFPLCALVFFGASTSLRIRRTLYVSDVAGRTAAELKGDAAAGGNSGRPHLIIPGHHNESFAWLDQTRQMIASGNLRVRHIDYENAPAGRDVYAASPYRWWLGLLAEGHRALRGGSRDHSVEWAALYADPLLLALLEVGSTLLIARRFGVPAAALVSVALVTLFPFAASFLPATPDDQGLAQGVAIWSVLPLLVGAGLAGADGEGAARRRERWFFAAGVVGGIGLWISVPRQAPLLAGIALGALLAAWVGRAGSANRAALPWRAWAMGGAVTCLTAYLVEYFPGYMGSWELRSLHPVFGLAWLGGGELLSRLVAWIAGRRPVQGLRDGGVAALAVAALASLPVALWRTHSLGFLTVDLPAMRLSLLPGSVSAPNLLAWLLQDGSSPTVLATLLPGLIVIPALALIVLGKIGQAERALVALSFGPVIMALGYAYREISYWNEVDCALIGLAVATMTALRRGTPSRFMAWTFGAAMTLACAPGAFRLWPGAAIRDALTVTETVNLIERDVAYWLAQHVGPGGAVVLAPPDATTALHYYSGMRGLGTFGWENRDGLTAAVRISSATTPEEAQELISRRGVTHIIIPAWDPLMDAYARMGGGQLEGTFLERLHRWVLPPWLRPVPYLIPTIPGFEGQSVTVLEVVDEQDDASAASRLAAYFVDMGQLDLATSAGQALKRFPADLGALLARAQVAIAAGDEDAFGRAVEVLLRRITHGEDRTLPWDQRVDLAVVLAQAHRLDLARTRLRQSLDDMDDEKLRSLSTNALYRLQVLRRALGLEIPDPTLRALSLDLLPPDLREQLSK